MVVRYVLPIRMHLTISSHQVSYQLIYLHSSNHLYSLPTWLGGLHMQCERKVGEFTG